MPSLTETQRPHQCRYLNVWNMIWNCGRRSEIYFEKEKESEKAWATVSMWRFPSFVRVSSLKSSSILKGLQKSVWVNLHWIVCIEINATRTVNTTTSRPGTIFCYRISDMNLQQINLSYRGKESPETSAPQEITGFQNLILYKVERLSCVKSIRMGHRLPMWDLQHLFDGNIVYDTITGTWERGVEVFRAPLSPRLDLKVRPLFKLLCFLNANVPFDVKHNKQNSVEEHVTLPQEKVWRAGPLPAEQHRSPLNW